MPDGRRGSISKNTLPRSSAGGSLNSKHHVKGENIRMIPPTILLSLVTIYRYTLSIPQRSTPAEVRVIAAGASLYVLIQCIYIQATLFECENFGHFAPAPLISHRHT